MNTRTFALGSRLPVPVDNVGYCLPLLIAWFLASAVGTASGSAVVEWVLYFPVAVLAVFGWARLWQQRVVLRTHDMQFAAGCFSRPTRLEYKDIQDVFRVHGRHPRLKVVTKRGETRDVVRLAAWSSKALPFYFWLVSSLAGCDPPVKERGVDETQAPASSVKPADHEAGFLEWARARADTELQSALDWTFMTGLASPPGQVNRPLHSWGRDSGHECKPEESIPHHGLCSGVHADPAGWRAHLTWKHDEPTVASIEIRSYAKLPMTCDQLRALDVGAWQADAAPGLWFGRICTAQDYQALIEQRGFADSAHYAKTRVTIYTNRFVQFDRQAALAIEAARKRAGL